MANEFGPAEVDAICPVPLARLGQIYRSDPDGITALLGEMPEDARIRLAVFCYGRAHLRDVGLSIAAQCSETRLSEMAGMIGQVLAVQCRAKVRTFGADAPARIVAKPRISLGGSRSF